MSAIYLNDCLGHYEVLGRGQPVIFLHSWLGSWRYWVQVMDEVAAQGYRAYALDFWGFGESECRGPFTLEAYAKMVLEFMDKMGLQKVHLVGHGLGGMVALLAAKEQPERFLRLMVVSTPLEGSSLKEAMKPDAFARLLGRKNLSATWARLVRQIPLNDTTVRAELYEDTDNLDDQVIQEIQTSMIAMDLKPILTALKKMSLLAVYGEKDSLIPCDQAQIVVREPNNCHQSLILPRLNHFPFLEATNIFSRLLLDFLASEGPVEVKVQWRRRVLQRDYL